MILISRKSSKPLKVNIEDQIIDVVEERAMEGAPTLTVTISDPNWLLVNSSILDLDTDSRLDHVEVLHNTEWYRLVKVSPQEGQVTLVFEDRIVSILREYKKPFRRLRTKGYTRGMFLRDLVREAQKDGHDMFFYSPSLRAVDQLQKAPKTPKDPPGTLGFSKGAHLTVKGARADKTQRHWATVALNTANDLNAPRRAKWALMEALIQESRIRNLAGGDGTSVGILQLTSGKKDRRNVKSCVTRFLLEGFTGRGGAITLANTTTLPPHLIAQACQGSFDSSGSNYQEWEAEAKEWVRRFHGLKGNDPPERTINADGAYYFQRGQAGQTEDSWTCMQRLAEEVNARVWVTDNVVVYMFDNQAYEQAPRNELKREKASVLGVGFDWDQGKPVQEMTVQIYGYDLWPGQTLEFIDAGPASTRWLIWDVQRTRSSGSTQATLRSPQAAKKVPRPASVSGSIPDPKKKSGGGGGSGGRDAPALKSGTAEVIRRAYRVIGKPGQGTHSFTAPPNNWESDNAVDLAVPYGTPLYAAFDGRIGPSFGSLGPPTSRFGGKRLHLVGAHDELYYAHMSLYRKGLGPGDKVKAGDLLGWSGTANSVEHLHLGDKTGAYIKRYLGIRQDPGNIPGRGD